MTDHAEASTTAQQEAAHEAEIAALNSTLERIYAGMRHKLGQADRVQAALLHERRDVARQLLNATFRAEQRRLDAAIAWRLDRIVTQTAADPRALEQELTRLRTQRALVHGRLNERHRQELHERWRDITTLGDLALAADAATQLVIDAEIRVLRDQYGAAQQDDPHDTRRLK